LESFAAEECHVPLKIDVTDSRKFARMLKLHGRLDNDTVAGLDQEVDQIAANRGLAVVVLELTDLDYISSVGIRSVFRLQKMMKTRTEGKALLVNPQPQVRKVFEIVNATDISAVFANDQELDAYLDAIQRKIVEGE
jgi:anti-anti-sigma factor